MSRTIRVIVTALSLVACEWAEPVMAGAATTVKSASADAAGQGHELPALLAMTPQAAPWADTRASGAIGEMPDLTGQFWISGAPQASIGVPRRPARAETAECGSDLAAILLRGVRLQV